MYMILAYDSFQNMNIFRITYLNDKGGLKNPMLNTFHGDAYKSHFSNALIIMELRTRT